MAIRALVLWRMLPTGQRNALLIQIIFRNQDCLNLVNKKILSLRQMEKHLPSNVVLIDTEPTKKQALCCQTMSICHTITKLYAVILSHSHYHTITKLYTVTLSHSHTVTLSHCQWHCLKDIMHVHINARVNSDAAVAGANVLFAYLPFNIGAVLCTC